ncbi:hypothetical protein MMC24_000533 [Lignoscripta atroalba]|nr:hypothetical protein [Lignoscripta atroalba]
MERPPKRQRFGFEDPYEQLHQRRLRNDLHLKSKFESLFEKYSKDFSHVGDEIDLETGEIVVDNGHLQSMQDEQDVRGGRNHPDELGDGSSEEDTKTGLLSTKDPVMWAEDSQGTLAIIPEFQAKDYVEDDVDSLMGDIQEPLELSMSADIDGQTVRQAGVFMTGRNSLDISSHKTPSLSLLENLQRMNEHHHANHIEPRVLEDFTVEPAWRAPPLTILQPKSVPRPILSSVIEPLEPVPQRSASPPGPSLWSSVRLPRHTITLARPGRRDSSVTTNAYHATNITSRRKATPLAKSRAERNVTPKAIPYALRSALPKAGTDERRLVTKTLVEPLGLRPSPWSPEEDKLLGHLKMTTSLSYREMERYFPGRTAGAIKIHWTTQIRGISDGPFTEQEDALLYRLKTTTVLKFGQMVKQFPGRTRANIRSRWLVIREEKNNIDLRSSHPPLQNIKDIPISRKTSGVLEVSNPAHGVDTHIPDATPMCENDAICTSDRRPHHTIAQVQHSDDKVLLARAIPEIAPKKENGSTTQTATTRYQVGITKSGKDNSPYTLEEDLLLRDLRENQHMAYKDIAKHFKGRSANSMRCHYSRIFNKLPATGASVNGPCRTLVQVQNFSGSGANRDPSNSKSLLGAGVEHGDTPSETVGESLSPSLRTIRRTPKRTPGQATASFIPARYVGAEDSKAVRPTDQQRLPSNSTATDRPRLESDTSKELSLEPSSSTNTADDQHEAPQNMSALTKPDENSSSKSKSNDVYPLEPFKVPSVVIPRADRDDRTLANNINASTSEDEFSMDSPLGFGQTGRQRNQSKSDLILKQEPLEEVLDCKVVASTKRHLPPRIYSPCGQSKSVLDKRKARSTNFVSMTPSSSMLGDFSDDELSLPISTIATPKTRHAATVPTSVRQCGSREFKCERSVCLRCA